MKRSYFNTGSMALAALLTAPLIAFGGAEPSGESARIRELEARIADLETRRAADNADIAATVDGVLRDAERRSQLLATSGDASAGYDKGFFIRAGDGWVLRPGVQFQFRNVTNFREEAEADGDSDWESGFEVRRLRFELAGNAFTKDLTYLFQWETARDGGTLGLLEAWVKYGFADNWSIRAGQFKNLTSHEYLLSAKRQLAADTSLVDALVGGGLGGYTQGASLGYGGYSKTNPLNVEVAITDGAGQFNTGFVDKDYDFGVAGRAEYKATGDWTAYQDFTAKGTKEDLLVIGAGGDWSQNGSSDQILGAADIAYENPAGFGAYAALLVRHLTDGDADDITDWGGLVQASYLFNQQWEIFARYGITLYDSDVSLQRGGSATGDLEDTFHEITVGVNYYLGTNGSAGHRAKFTVDLTYLPNGAPKAVSGLGILDSNGGEDEWLLRTQFQLLL